MPDPRVQELERAIAELRADVRGDLKDLKSVVDQVNGHIADLMLEVGDAPDHRYRESGRPNLRSRVHALENDRAAVKIAEAVIKAAEEEKGQQWTRWQKIALFLIAVVGMILGILAAIGVTQ